MKKDIGEDDKGSYELPAPTIETQHDSVRAIHENSIAMLFNC